MKLVNCPRCQGSGKVDERETLVGIAPFHDRPSGVNDDDWNLADQDEDFEKTALAEVPVFTMPKRLQRIPSERPPKVESIPVEAMEPEEDSTPRTPPISARAQLQPPPKTPKGAPLWLMMICWITLGMAIGGVMVSFKDVINGWIDSFVHP